MILNCPSAFSMWKRIFGVHGEAWLCLSSELLITTIFKYDVLKASHWCSAKGFGMKVSFSLTKCRGIRELLYCFTNLSLSSLLPFCKKNMLTSSFIAGQRYKTTLKVTVYTGFCKNSSTFEIYQCQNKIINSKFNGSRSF